MQYEAGTVSLNVAMITIQVCVGIFKHHLIFINSEKLSQPPYSFKPHYRYTSRKYKVESVSEAHSRTGWYSELRNGCGYNTGLCRNV